MSLRAPGFDPGIITRPRTIIPAALRQRLGSFLKGPPRGPRQRHKQACVVCLGRIGDFVLCLPTLRLLAREFGESQLTVVVPAVISGLAAIELPGVEAIALTSEAGSLLREIVPIWWRERRKFASVGFARQITLNHYRSFYHEVASSWIDAQQDFRLVPATYPAAGPDGQCTELHAHRLLASAVLGRAVAWAEIVPAFTQFPVANDGRLLVYPLSRDGLRSISAERVVSILRPWRAGQHAPIVFSGSPSHAGELERYAATARAAGLAGVSVETPAGAPDFIAHLAAAGAVLASDSAAGHIGGAFDKPTVVLVTPAWHGLSQPWQRSARQRAFLFDTPDAEIAAALPVL